MLQARPKTVDASAKKDTHCHRSTLADVMNDHPRRPRERVPERLQPARRRRQHDGHRSRKDGKTCSPENTTENTKNNNNNNHNHRHHNNNDSIIEKKCNQSTAFSESSNRDRLIARNQPYRI